MKPDLLPTTPEPIAPDTWLIPTLAADPAGGFLGAHSAVIRGREPIVIDTSVLFGRDQWLQNVFSVVEPEDVRWIFLSHDDHDHLGNLDPILDLCPNATLLANYAMTGRLFGDVELPLERMRWINVGESIDVGDRELAIVRPPMFDSPASRGLFDTSTGMLWAADSFGTSFPGAVYDADDIPAEVYDPSFELLNLLNTPVDGVGRPGPLRRPRAHHRVAAAHRGRECARSACTAVIASPTPSLVRGRSSGTRRPSSPGRTCSSSCVRCSRPRASEELIMGTIPRHVSVEVVVDAPPTAVWEVVGDPRRTGEWSHECLEVAFVDGSTEPVVGAALPGPEQGRPKRLDPHVRDRRVRARARDQLADDPDRGLPRQHDLDDHGGVRRRRHPGHAALRRGQARTRLRPVHLPVRARPPRPQRSPPGGPAAHRRGGPRSGIASRRVGSLPSEFRGESLVRCFRSAPLAALVLTALVSASVASATPASAAKAKKPATITVLVTNDDGVGAPGIDGLVEALRKVKNTKVVVVAPAANQSGSGGAPPRAPSSPSRRRPPAGTTRRRCKDSRPTRSTPRSTSWA